jgi:hypothetical protein
LFILYYLADDKKYFEYIYVNYFKDSNSRGILFFNNEVYS